MNSKYQFLRPACFPSLALLIVATITDAQTDLGTAAAKKPTKSTIDVRPPLQIIADKGATPEEVRKAIVRLGKGATVPSFWAKIANDPAYGDEHRRECIAELFRRHVKEGMTIGELSKTLDKPTWLVKANVDQSLQTNGVIPLPTGFGGYPASLDVFPEVRGNSCTVYLSLSESTSADDLSAALHGDKGTERAARVKIVEIAVSYDR